MVITRTPRDPSDSSTSLGVQAMQDLEWIKNCCYGEEKAIECEFECEIERHWHELQQQQQQQQRRSSNSIIEQRPEYIDMYLCRNKTEISKQRRDRKNLRKERQKRRRSRVVRELARNITKGMK